MKAIVITSIFHPTEAVRRFAAMQGYAVIVVGDRKTPSGWNYPNVQYLSIEDQLTKWGRFAKLLPENHYCRKMLGYLLAMELGATEIIDTDDDNIPYDHWGFPPVDVEIDLVPPGRGFINVYRYFTSQKIWPRGLPLSEITQWNSVPGINEKCEGSTIGIWQGLADNDPDVDAIYRLTDNSPCIFNKRLPLALGQGSYSTFNSQNTLFRKMFFPLLYLPSTVSFRYTDILRGLIALPILELYGFRLGFTDATVEQIRNPHNFMQDFLSELNMYLDGDKVIPIIQGQLHKDLSVSDNLKAAYECLKKVGLVKEEELLVLNQWSDCCEGL